MTTGDQPPSRFWLSLYRRLASAYPHEFRMRFGEELDRMGEDAIPEVGRRYGAAGLARLLTDIALRLPAMYLLEMRQDAAYALRTLAKSPGFTAVAVLSVAIGIGMCSAFLSEIRSVTGPAAGIPDPEDLVTTREPVSYPYFERYREQPDLAGATAILGPAPFTVAFSPDRNVRAERFFGHLVSPEYFSTLGVEAAWGRVFDPRTEKPGMAPVVVVSERFWRAHLDADPQAVGRSLRLNGSMATIVGVAPKGFQGIWPGNPADLFVPVTCATALAPELAGDPLREPGRAIFRVVFRLAHGVSLPMAEASLNAATRNLDRDNGLGLHRDRGGKLVRLMPAGTVMYMRPEQRAVAEMLNVIVWALVLALVCANLANLLLARGSARRREIAIRLSVGASRFRLIRQFLTESVILSLAGAVLGVGFAYGMTAAISSLPVPSPVPVEYHCLPDFGVLVITMAIALAAGVGFGLAPALSSARVPIGPTLKAGAQAPLRGYRGFGLRNLFVICQMTASLMLLLVTWFLTLSYFKNANLDPGYETAHLNLFGLDPVRDGQSPADAAALFAALPAELSRVSGVRGVSLAGSVPFASEDIDSPNTHVSTSAGDGPRGQAVHAVFRDRVGAHYFATLGVPVLSGREFEQRDGLDESALPAIVNQTAARELFGGEDAIGRRVREGDQSYTVVGITRDMASGFMENKPVPSLFLPLTGDLFRRSPAESITVLVRSAPGSDAMAAARNQLASLHPGLTVFNMRTMREDLVRLNTFERWDAAICEVLGLFALLLASIGLGAVTAYAVAQRRKEIGIRMALGARGGQVQRLVLREGTALVGTGTALGLLGAYLLLRAMSASSALLERSLHQRFDDPLLVIGAPLLLAGLAMLACYLPARRATKIDPMSALWAD